MPRWLIDEIFADIPECHGYLPLSIAFSQFLAVECDEDPLDRERLRENLNTASAPQELQRWFVRLLQSGELRSASRPQGGGAVTPMPPTHWQADSLTERFMTSLYARQAPFDPRASTDSWIFVREDDYIKVWEKRKAEYLEMSTKPARRSRKRVQAEAGPQRSDTLLIDVKDVESLVGMSRSYIYRLIDEKRFPGQIKFGTRSLWRREAIEAWVAEIPSDSRSDSE